MGEEKQLSADSGQVSEQKSTSDAPKKLGLFTILLITINSIMGTGIFFLPSVGAREAGLLSLGSWLIMGLIAIYFSMIFAELVGIYPKEGGVYEYAKEAFGNFPSFLLGWMTLIAAYITIAMLIVGAILYVGPTLPKFALILISIGFICVFNFMAFKGLKTGAVMLVSFAFITLIAVFGIMIPGFLNFDPGAFTGFFDHEKLIDAPGGIAGLFASFSVIIVTIFYIAETFFGWETTTFLAEQVDNPKKVMPKVMVIATVFIAICSLAFVVASFSLIPWQEFALSTTPLADLASVIYGSQIGQYYGILVYLAIIGSVAGWIVASPNLILALAKDKMFIPQLSAIHKTNGTPYKAIIFQTFVCSALVIVGAGNYETLLHLLVPLVLLLYAAVVLSLIFIRKKNPNIERSYIAPGGKYGPWFLIVFVFFLLAMWISSASYAMSTLALLSSFIIIGLPVYLLLYLYYDPQATLKFKNETAVLSIFLERLFFPRRIQKHFLANTIIRGHTVLELGASSGLVSKDIAMRSPKKQIIIEHSKHMTNYLKKRLGKYDHIEIIDDELLHSRIHPSVGHVDEVISFGVLSEIPIQAIDHYLKSLAAVMPQHGRIHFFDYVDMYKVLPNTDLLSNMDRLTERFNNAGFAVTIRKQKGLLWNYLIIDGIRTDNPRTVYI